MTIGGSGRDMNSSSGTPGGGTPRTGGLDEATMLAFIEGELSPSEAARVERAMAASPALARWLKDMQQDRAALRSIPIEHAPAGMLASVEAMLEREALLDPVIERIPEDHAPSYRPPERHTRGRFGRGAQVALAAGLALMVGGASLYMASSSGLRGPGPAPAPTPGALAQNSEAQTAAPAPEPVRIASAESNMPRSTAGTASTASRAASTDAVQAIAPPRLDAQRAVLLASENRLAIRVSSRDADRVLSRAADLADAQPAVSNVWRLETIGDTTRRDQPQRRVAARETPAEAQWRSEASPPVPFSNMARTAAMTPSTDTPAMTGLRAPTPAPSRDFVVQSAVFPTVAASGRVGPRGMPVQPQHIRATQPAHTDDEPRLIVMTVRQDADALQEAVRELTLGLGMDVELVELEGPPRPGSPSAEGATPGSWPITGPGAWRELPVIVSGR